MFVADSSLLSQLFERFAIEPSTEALRSAWLTKPHGSAADRVYRDALEWLERKLWSGGVQPELLALYQALFREFEQQRDADSDDRRHHFVVVIPVADRPEHLRSCLASLLKLCQLYRYGSYRDGRFTHVSVLLADDSEQHANQRSHREIAADFTARGLTTEYFGADAQRELFARLSVSSRSALQRMLGSGEPLHHKGASITRNLAYLHLASRLPAQPRQLFYCIDSDQEFRVRIDTAQGERNLYALNYLHQLDRIFTTTDAQVLTGKVVGDPPVSPAVMAGNFLEDVLGFLSRMAQLDVSQACQFHQPNGDKVSDASYHDMADLFGFKSEVARYDYHCTLDGAHDHAACFADFAVRLNRFFDGEHPTRHSYYEPAELHAGIQSARTIYTGNYIFRPSALRFGIPFASLKLRMAGPVMGRLIKAEIGPGFVSVNLPMLHKRTVAGLGQSEFRPGIEHGNDRIDLCGEFERQFFGDVMLFTVEQLTAQGYPARSLSNATIEQSLITTEERMFELYSAKQVQILNKLERLESLFADPAQWWQAHPELVDARADFARFIANMQHNFGGGACGYSSIAEPAKRERRHAQMLSALCDLAADQDSWQRVLESLSPTGAMQAERTAR